ncbi:MAG: TRAP transporter small permease [Rhodobacteraceae bacterium]|nr:TRAP transporter small permease [Paracoccaceae bacterium]
MVRQLLAGLDMVSARLARGAALLGCLALLSITLLVSVDVLGRWLAGVTTRMAVEVSGYLVVAVVFLGLADTYLQNAHIRVDALGSCLPRRPRAVLTFVNRILIILFCVVVFWFTFRSAVSSFRFGSSSRTNIDITLWPIQALIPIGLSLLIAVVLSDVLRGRPDRSAEAAEAAGHD